MAGLVYSSPFLLSAQVDVRFIAPPRVFRPVEEVTSNADRDRPAPTPPAVCATYVIDAAQHFTRELRIKASSSSALEADFGVEIENSNEQPS